MKHKNFAVLILSHGRPDKVVTIPTLRKFGYTGDIYIVIDDEDETEHEYRARFGNSIIQFCKKEAAKDVDAGDNEGDRRTVVFARNSCHRIAADLGLEYFLVLDDDYVRFQFRFIKNDKLLFKYSDKLDVLFDAMLDFLDVSGAVTVALSQGGDFIGGAGNGNIKKELLRKAMNAFFCRTDRPFKFYGWINEDATAYATDGQRGVLFFTVTKASVEQMATQSNPGGLTTAYLDTGTYRKSFYSVMYAPSCVRAAAMHGAAHKRIHHLISWRNCTPKILNERHRKK